MKNRGGMLVLAMLLLIGGLAGCDDGGQVVVGGIGPEGGSDVAVAGDPADPQDEDGAVAGDPADPQDGATATDNSDDSQVDASSDGQSGVGEDCSSIKITTKIYEKDDTTFAHNPSLTPTSTAPTADINFSSDAEEVMVVWRSSSPVESWNYEVSYMSANGGKNPISFTEEMFEEWTEKWTAQPSGKNKYQLTIPRVDIDKVYAFVTIQPIATVGDCLQKGAQLRFTMDN